MMLRAGVPARRDSRTLAGGLVARLFSSRFGFHAPLRTSVLLAKGVGAASYTGATVKTVKDFEGGIRNTLSGEVRFEGQRRVNNRVPHSTDFSNAGWTATNAPTLASSTSVPDGTAFTASNKVTAATGASRGYNFVTLTVGEVYIISCWLKGEAGGESVYLSDTAGSNGTFTVDTTWRRYSRVLTAGNTQAYFAVQNLSGSDKTVYFVGMQVERVIGQSNQNPSEYVSVGAAKLNELIYSEELNLLTPVRSTITANDATNPVNGAQSAEKIVEDATAANTHGVRSTTSAHVSGTQYTLSCYVKAGTRTWVYVQAVPSSSFGCYFNLTNGTVGTPAAGTVGSIEAVGGGWYRCAITYTADGVAATSDVLMATGDGGANYNGDGASYIHAFGFQRVVGSSPGTYFPVGNVYPFHGACVDGVKYFDYENGNTVSSNIVTEAVGRSLDGYSVALLDGSTGYFSTPDSTALRITGKISLRAQVRAEDFTPSATQALIAKSGNRYMLRINTTGGLIFTWYDGSVQISQSSTLPFPASDKTMLWARTDFEPDNGAGGRTTRFYWSADYNPDTLIGTWTLFDTITDAGVTQIGGHDTGALTVGYSASGPILAGAIRRAQVFNNDTGTKVADFNPREGWTENQLLQSEDANTTWSKTQITVSTDAIASPVGVVNADLLLETAFNTSHSLLQNITYTAEPFILSGYFKPNGRTWFALSNGVNYCYFNASGSGSVGFASAGVVGTIQAATDGWYFAKMQFTPVAGLGSTGIYLASADNTSTYLGDVTKGGYVWGLQLRRLSVAGQRTTSQYLPTTTAALRGWISSTGEQWTINGAATVLQRQAEGYLPEGASTNLVLQSSTLNTTWLKGGTPVATEGAAYCGDIGLTLLNDDDGAAAEYVYQNITFTADASKSVSCLIKAGTATTTRIDLVGAATRLRVDVTWSGGAPVPTFTTGSLERAAEALGNGVYRLFLLASGVVAADTNTLYIYPAGATAASTGTVYIGGVQAENATVASSLIPTTTGTAARNADFLSYPDAGNISSAVGTSFIEVGPIVGSGATQVLLGHGDLSGRMVYNAGTPAVMTTYDGVNSVSSTSALAPTRPAKIATAWGNGALKICTDAGIGTTVFDGSMGVSGTISIGSAPAGNQMQGTIKNVRIAQVALSNGELVAISR